jgi:hypothetical protein
MSGVKITDTLVSKYIGHVFSPIRPFVGMLRWPCISDNLPTEIISLHDFSDRNSCSFDGIPSGINNADVSLDPEKGPSRSDRGCHGS